LQGCRPGNAPSEDPRKYPWNPDPKSRKFPNFYPDSFGKFLSGWRIWVRVWANFIRTWIWVTPNRYFHFFSLQNTNFSLCSSSRGLSRILQAFCRLKFHQNTLNLPHFVAPPHLLTPHHPLQVFSFQQELSKLRELSCCYL